MSLQPSNPKPSCLGSQAISMNQALPHCSLETRREIRSTETPSKERAFARNVAGIYRVSPRTCNLVFTTSRGHVKVVPAAPASLQQREKREWRRLVCARTYHGYPIPFHTLQLSRLRTASCVPSPAKATRTAHKIKKESALSARRPGLYFSLTLQPRS